MTTFTDATGDLLDATADALVNTVNTVGVMGKGIALQFKHAYPSMFKDYAQACKRGNVCLGEMWVFDAGQITRPRWIVNFPTKGHWRSNSRSRHRDWSRRSAPNHQGTRHHLHRNPATGVWQRWARLGHRPAAHRAGARRAQHRGVALLPGYGSHGRSTRLRDALPSLSFDAGSSPNPARLSAFNAKQRRPSRRSPPSTNR